MGHGWSLIIYHIQLQPEMSNKNAKNGLYGCISGSVVAAALQPIQNIKMALLVPPKDLVLTNNFLKNVPIATNYLYQDAKISAFYRGITANVMRTGMSSSIFFSSLRFNQKLQDTYKIFQDTRVASFVSSLVSRVISCCLTNPLSVIETRYQFGGKDRWSGSLFKNFQKMKQTEGIRGFFNGCLTTCYKQGLFAGMYYALYQEGKAYGIPSFPAGILAGMISTSITHPFEIVRAQIQSFVITANTSSQLSISKQILLLFQTGEAFRGLTPRVIKKPITNTLAFYLFQKMQQHGLIKE